MRLDLFCQVVWFLFNKSYDNKYHVNVRFGVAETSKSHKYSDAFIDLLKKVIAGQPYKVDADEIIVAGTGG